MGFETMKSWRLMHIDGGDDVDLPPIDEVLFLSLYT